ncbi:hypothetical protein P7C71_g1236, partial [Lecanoromycetidae sp. Uapishka_2]
MAPSPPTNIDTLNALSLSSLCAQFFPYDSTTLQYNHNGISNQLILQLETPSTILPQDMKACFDLIATTSAADYMTSSVGWSPANKRKEMRLPDLRYMLLKRRSLERDEEEGSVVGFLSFMFTYEDGQEVVYCYEVHLAAESQGKGVGKKLMQMMEEAGRKARVKKAMLTSFKANGSAIKFYEKLGYEEDEYSPRPRKLRNGIVKEPDYVILSKILLHENEASDVKDADPTTDRSGKLEAG